MANCCPIPFSLISHRMRPKTYFLWCEANFNHKLFGVMSMSCPFFYRPTICWDLCTQPPLPIYRVLETLQPTDSKSEILRSKIPRQGKQLPPNAHTRRCVPVLRIKTKPLTLISVTLFVLWPTKQRGMINHKENVVYKKLLRCGISLTSSWLTKNIAVLVPVV